MKITGLVVVLLTVSAASSVLLFGQASPTPAPAPVPTTTSQPPAALAIADPTLMAALAGGDVIAGPGTFTWANSGAPPQILFSARPQNIGGSSDTAYLTIVNRSPNCTARVFEGGAFVFQVDNNRTATGVVKIEPGNPITVDFIGQQNIDILWSARRR